MRNSRPLARVAAATVAAGALACLTASAALAGTPAGSGCAITVEPATISVGGQFTVEGNFGGASVYVLPGRDAMPGESEEPDATTPAGSSFSVTFTHTGAPGDLTVVAVIPETECGATANVTVTAALPDTATDPGTDTVSAFAGLALLGSAVLTARRRARRV